MKALNPFVFIVAVAATIFNLYNFLFFMERMDDYNRVVEKCNDHLIMSRTFEEQSGEEVTNIYRLIQAQASGVRTIMNMNIDNNHETEGHEGQVGLPCKECREIYKGWLANLPDYPDGSRDKYYIDTFYRNPIEYYEKQIGVEQ
tara:strand:+ start:1155 stop:1586 length:432 start_codon:yes stop_codon:yes gene_type:complete